MKLSELLLLSAAGLLVALTGALAPTSVRAQPAVELTVPSDAPIRYVERVAARADPATVARMEQLLLQRSRSEEASGLFNGVLNLGIGATLIASSLWLALDVDAFGGLGGPSPAVITGLAVAPMMIASGIYSIVGIRRHGDRLLRWRAAMNGELSPLELGRFEGELRADANAARVSRWGSFALGVGILGGGVISMILGGAFEDFDDELRAITIGSGGGLAIIGGVVMGTSFMESSVEQMWTQYRRGGAPESAGLTIQPVIGPGGIGLVGTF